MALDEHIEGGFFRCYSNASGFEYASGIVAECDFIPTGGEEFRITNIVSIHPNPARHQVTLRLPRETNHCSTYQIYGLDGMMLVAGNICENSVIIPLGSIRPGMYFFHIQNNTSSIKSKLIITH
jgi:hypothetical protein